MAGAVASVATWVVVVTGVGLLVFVGLGPRTGRYRTLTVLSGSMTPGIPVGSVVVVTPERPDQLRVGQVVTYRIPVDDHRVVSHRVVKVFEGGSRPVFQTQGDANDAPDQWIAQLSGDTVWRARYVVPGLGHGLQWLRRPAVHTASVLVVPGVVALWVVCGIWREDEDGGDGGADVDDQDGEAGHVPATEPLAA
jgi:signal peptidase I